MSNVYPLFEKAAAPVILDDFTDQEKHLLADIAMEFRDRDINVRLSFVPGSKIPLVNFIEANGSALYISITRHQTDNMAEYRFSPSVKSAEQFVNFSNLLIACRTWLEDYHRQPIVELQSYRKG